MILRNLIGERVGPVPVNYCTYRTSNGNPLLQTGKRPRDVDVAADAALALWRGQSVLVGSNAGKFGEGTAIRYRGRSEYNNPGDWVTTVDKFVSSGGQWRMADDMNKVLGSFTTPDSLYNDILSELRNAYFRVIRFGDPWQRMDMSEIHPYAMEYTVPVAARLTAQVVPEDHVCNLATHARRGFPNSNVRYTPW